MAAEPIRPGGFAQGVQPDPLVARLIQDVAEIYERIENGDIDLTEWELDR